MTETNKSDDSTATFEEYKEFVKNMESTLLEFDEKTIFQRYLEYLSPILVALVASIIVFSTGIGGDRSRTVSKDVLVKDISIAISNDADLRSVKQIFSNRDLRKKNFFSFKNEVNVYKESVPLSVVLEDIRANQFLSDSTDLEFIKKIDNIILDHNQTNPFDRLDDIQKDMFVNVRLKLPENYPVIQNDINKIAEEMNVKNLLVDKYLDRSTMSFWVSISALVFSISIAILQLYQNRAQKIHEIVSSVITKSLKSTIKNK